MVVPFLPPTSNHLYIKGTILTAVARKFAEDFSAYVMQNYGHVVTSTKLNPLAIYGLRLIFYFDSLVNPSFMDMKVPPSKRAKSRYKRIDLTNRVKLLEDCVRDALAIDDSQTFIAMLEKHHDPGNPRVEIDVWEVNPSDFGIPPLEVFMV